MGEIVRMMKTFKLLIFLLPIFFYSCMQKESSEEVSCMPGTQFDPVTRECVTYNRVDSFFINEKETKALLIDYSDLIKNLPTSCEVLSESGGIDVSCMCVGGSCYATVSPDQFHFDYPYFFGLSDFSYRLSDGIAYSKNVLVNVTVVGVDDPPIISSPYDITVSKEGADAFEVQLPIEEVDGQALSFSILSSGKTTYGGADLTPRVINGKVYVTIDYSLPVAYTADYLAETFPEYDDANYEDFYNELTTYNHDGYDEFKYAVTDGKNEV